MNSLINEYVLSRDSAGQYVEGICVKILDNFYVRNVVENVSDNFYLGYSDIYTLVNPMCCAKRLGSLLNKENIYEYDVFQTSDGIRFYVSFDYMNLAIVYFTEKDKCLPDNVNLFNCNRIGNIKTDDPMLFVNELGEFIFD